MNITELLIREEGYRQFPYRDSVGKLTVGYGRNLDAKGVSKEEARMLLENDLEEVRNDLERHIPWYLSLSEPRRGVVESMAFQLGITGLMGFRKFLAYLRNGKIEQAGEEMTDSKWARQSPNRVARLKLQLILDQWT